MLYLAISFAVTFLVTVLLLKTPLASIALDKPNHRSLHTKVTPRTGGLAIVAGLISTWMLIGPLWLLLVPLLLLLVVSLIDDVMELPVRWRLLTQLIVSSIFVSLLFPAISWWLVALLVLVITWMINLYNFMDGSDGLAGGMALFGFGGYSIAAYLSNDFQIAFLSGAIASAALAFLVFNFHPAKIFMGDAGSVPLGFLSASLGLCGLQRDLWPAWFPLLVFSPFIVDASVTLMKRLFLGEKIWQAHRSHYYQRLIIMNFGHRNTALMEYCLMATACLSALFLLNQSPMIQIAALILWVMLYAFLACVIDRIWRNFNKPGTMNLT